MAPSDLPDQTRCALATNPTMAEKLEMDSLPFNDERRFELFAQAVAEGPESPKDAESEPEKAGGEAAKAAAKDPHTPTKGKAVPEVPVFSPKTSLIDEKNQEVEQEELSLRLGNLRPFTHFRLSSQVYIISVVFHIQSLV